MLNTKNKTNLQVTLLINAWDKDDIDRLLLHHHTDNKHLCAAEKSR